MVRSAPPRPADGLLFCGALSRATSCFMATLLSFFPKRSDQNAAWATSGLSVVAYVARMSVVIPMYLAIWGNGCCIAVFFGYLGKTGRAPHGRASEISTHPLYEEYGIASLWGRQYGLYTDNSREYLSKVVCVSTHKRTKNERQGVQSTIQ